MTVFGDVFTLVAIMVMMLAIDWRLALVAFAVIPLVWLTAAVFRRRVREAFRRHPGPAGPAQRLSAGAAPGMRVVQLFGREEESARRFAALNRDHLEAHLRSITIYAVFFPVVEVLTAVALALLLWYGGLRVLGRHPHRRRAGGVHPVTRRFFQPLQDLSREVQPAAERHGVVGAGLRACWTSR